MVRRFPACEICDTPEYANNSAGGRTAKIAYRRALWARYVCLERVKAHGVWSVGDIRWTWFCEICVREIDGNCFANILHEKRLS